MNGARLWASARVVSALGVPIVLMVVLPGAVMAGTWDEVYVDHILVPNGGDCNLYQYVWVQGVYTPGSPWDADIAWRINTGNWHDVSEIQGANGKIGFGSTMSENAGQDDTL